jgi:hypothetical protein
MAAAEASETARADAHPIGRASARIAAIATVMPATVVTSATAAISATAVTTTAITAATISATTVSITTVSTVAAISHPASRTRLRA